jgi:hypothetical protein
MILLNNDVESDRATLNVAHGKSQTLLQGPDL